MSFKLITYFGSGQMDGKTWRKWSTIFGNFFEAHLQTFANWYSLSDLLNSWPQRFSSFWLSDHRVRLMNKHDLLKTVKGHSTSFFISSISGVPLIFNQTSIRIRHSSFTSCHSKRDDWDGTVQTRCVIVFLETFLSYNDRYSLCHSCCVPVSVCLLNKCATTCSGRVVSAPVSYLRGPGSSGPWNCLSWMRFFVVFIIPSWRKPRY